MSKVSDTADIMRRLLWNNVLRTWAIGVIATIPILNLPVVSAMTLALFENFVMENALTIKLFKELSSYGIFTSIDWKSDEEYDAYKKEAEKLVPLQSQPDWPIKERMLFREAASNLIHLHLKSNAA